ncbi:unnamed protein product, partial [Meganyctiphanes norvegica]
MNEEDLRRELLSGEAATDPAGSQAEGKAGHKAGSIVQNQAGGKSDTNTYQAESLICGEHHDQQGDSKKITQHKGALQNKEPPQDTTENTEPVVKGRQVGDNKGGTVKSSGGKKYDQHE